jgi:hypothetical protein
VKLLAGQVYQHETAATMPNEVAVAVDSLGRKLPAAPDRPEVAPEGVACAVFLLMANASL